MSESEFNINIGTSNLTISHQEWFDSQNETGEWRVSPLGSTCIVVRKGGATANDSNEPDALMGLSADLLRDVLDGLMRRKWSGYLQVDAGMGIQKIFLVDGELSFASSTLMDHRLGEVIYRNGTISLEKLTETAVQVTRAVKFGQVLLRGGAFNSVDLWDALRSQVLQIVKTLFLAKHVFVELVPGRDLAPTSVVFAENSEQIINDAYYFGRMFRDFNVSVDFNAFISVDESLFGELEIKPETFQFDIVELVREHGTLSKTVEASKLTPSNTIAAVMDLVNRGVLKLAGIKPSTSEGLRSHPLLQSKLDAYSFMVRQVRTAFALASLPMPAQELSVFALRLNPQGFTSIYLTPDCDVHPESVRWMGSQCANSDQRAGYFSYRVEALTQFLIQIAQDMLPQATGRSLRNEFKQLHT